MPVHPLLFLLNVQISLNFPFLTSEALILFKAQDDWLLLNVLWRLYSEKCQINLSTIEKWNLPRRSIYSILFALLFISLHEYDNCITLHYIVIFMKTIFLLLQKQLFNCNIVKSSKQAWIWNIWVYFYQSPWNFLSIYYHFSTDIIDFTDFNQWLISRTLTDHWFHGL